MQKVIDLLEQYVEWVALAIGGIFLLLMVVFYLVGTPISVSSGTRTLTPANVEQQTYTEAGQKLELAMNETRVPVASIEPYASKFEDFMAMKDLKQPELATKVWMARGAPSAPLKEEKKEAPGPKQAVASVAETLPAPKWYGASNGKTYVNTDVKNPVVPAAMGGMPEGFGAPPGVFGPPPEEAGPYGGYAGMPPMAAARVPAAAAGVGGAKPDVAVPGGADKVWITEAFTISTDALAKTFADAKVPANLPTVFLRLDVVREEKMPDGTWGNRTNVEPLRFHEVPPFPKPGNSVDERVYLDWASKNAQTLLAPSFYPKVAGDTWFAPGQPNPNKIEVKPVVNPTPAQPPRGRQPRGVYGPGGVPPGVGAPPRGRMRQPNYAAADEQRPPTFGPPPEAMRAAQAAAAAASAQAAARAGYGGFPGAGYGEEAGGVGRATAAVPDGYKVPSGTFNPGELGADIFLWFHDDTVEPGKTYRYQLSYRLRNPLYGYANLVTDPAAAKQFALQSEPSEWSKEITAEVLSKFFVASGVPVSGNSINIDVFRWQEGKWNSKKFSVSPGDLVGAMEGKIDFQTGWSLVDLQSNAKSDQPIILVDSRGQLQSRSYRDDVSAKNQFIKDTGWKDPNAPQPRVPTPGMPEDYGPYGGPPGGVGFP